MSHPQGECQACADEGSDAEGSDAEASDGSRWTVECGRRGPDGQAVSVWERVGDDVGTLEDAEIAAVELAIEDANAANAAELDEYVTLYEYRVVEAAQS